MSDMSSMHNSITWTEIPATDISRAKEFYTAVFGWSFPALGPPTDAPPTVAIFNHSTTNGSLIKVDPDNMLSPALHPNNPEKKRVAVRVTIAVESVDRKLGEVEENGGKLYLPKREIPGNMGVVAYFTDTEGNVMGLWSKE